MEVNDLSFNQDFSHILVSSLTGHRIFNCEPFGEFYALPSDKVKPKATAILRMLFSTSLTVIVPKDETGTRILHVYNLKTNTKICELTFSLGIVDLMLNRRRLIVFLEVGQIYIYDLSSIRVVKILDVNSFLRPDGRRMPVQAALSSNDNSLLVIPVLMVSAQTDLFNISANNSRGSSSHPGTPILRPTDSPVTQAIGHFVEFTRKNTDTNLFKTDVVTLEDIQSDSPGWVLIYDTINLLPKLVYKAHDAGIAKIAISNDGDCIATASQKGTIVRVCHVTNDPSPLSTKLNIIQITNLRRGHNHTIINALQFNQDLSILGCSSESNTIHLFTVKERDPTLKNSEADDSEEYSSEEDDRSGKSSLEDLNENLANLLLLKQPESPAKEKLSSSSYFSALKTSKKILNNLYTKSLMRKIPYRDYLDNLIWEKPRRSFAYVKLPEYVPTHKQHKNVEIGFTSSGILMLASYNTGILYHYRIPRGSIEGREECGLFSQNILME